MATSGPTNLPAFFNTDAEFRTWGSTIAAALAAFGLVQTADTGQINWATVAKPAAINTAQGYEIWRFADALQATAPVFIKVEYGSSGAATRPGLWFTVGPGSSGAGAITGSTTTRKQLAIPNDKTAGAVLPTYLSGSTSSLRGCINLDSTNTGFSGFFCVERTRDPSTFAETADGVYTFFGASTATYQYQFLPTGATAGTAVARPPALGPETGAFSASGSDVALSPHIVFKGKPLPILGLLTYRHADIVELASFTATHLGAVHTFMPLGDGGVSAAAVCQDSGPTQTHAIAILWE